MGIARKPSNEKPLPANESEENLRYFETGNGLAFFEALSTLNLTKILHGVFDESKMMYQ